MKFWKRLSIAAPASAGLLLIVGFAVVFYNESAYRQGRIGELRVEAQTLASTVTAALVFGDKDAANEYVGALAADPAIRAAAIYTPNGVLVAGYLRAGALPLPTNLRPDDHPVEEGRLVVTEPVVQKGMLLGTVYVRVLREPTLLLVQRYGSVLLLAVMAALVVVVLGLAQTVLARAYQDLAAANLELQQQIAERERVEGTLRQTQKMEAVGQLTGGIAHDFNNMLAIVMGSLEMIKLRLARGQTDIGKYVENAWDGANRAASLTRRLLAFSRKQPLAPSVTDLNTLVVGMADLLQRTLGGQIKFECILGDGLWQTYVDPSQVESSILNLAVNARDAMTDGGRLTIETMNDRLGDDFPIDHPEAAMAEYAVVAVSDTGTGMSQEVIARAFDPFYTTKEIGQGTGLGLSQVYGFVKQSGGHVKILSELGVGTTVKMYLPRHDGKGDLAPIELKRSIEATVPTGAPDEIILVVEDEEGVRRSNVEALRELGYTVLHASSGDEALGVLRSHEGVKLLFTDVMMPGMTGRKLAELVAVSCPDIRVLYATGYAADAIVHDGKVDPGVVVLIKPFGFDQLAHKVRSVLDGRSSDA